MRKRKEMKIILLWFEFESCGGSAPGVGEAAVREARAVDPSDDLRAGNAHEREFERQRNKRENYKRSNGRQGEGGMRVRGKHPFNS